MKNKNFILACGLLLPLVLVGCSVPNTSETHTSEQLPSSETTTEPIPSETTTQIPSETTSEDVSSETTSQPNQPIKIDFYAVNDRHGRIVEGYDSKNNYEPGLARTQTFLKQLKAQSENFVHLNSGDEFQDTYDSGTNRGELMAKALPIMGTDAFAIGNHEFDWGVDYLKANRSFAQNTPFLGANIYHYDEINKKATDFASDLCQPYTIIERSGLKIGIIGIIGREQITSITSSCTKGYTFLEPTDIVAELSDELRTQKDCDIVVVSSHADRKQLDDQGPFSYKLTSISEVSGKRYIDACFTAHSHKFQNEMINGEVPFLQSGAHGSFLGHIQLQYNDGRVSCLASNQIEIPHGLQPDSEVETLINSYLNDEFYQTKNEVIGNIEGSYALPRNISGQMLAWMTYERLSANSDCPSIDVVINNGGRSEIELKAEGGVTRGLLYDAMPFTNQTHVVKIKGSDIQTCVDYKRYGSYKNQYYAPKAITIDPDAYYTAAIIDYMLLHQTSDRQLDYFPSFNGETLYLEKEYSIDIMADYFIEHKTITWDQVSNLPGYTNIPRH